MMYQASFYRNGKFVYEWVNGAGSIGAVTGIKNGKFAISLNARNNRTLFDNVYEMLIKGAMSPTYLIRETLEKAENYLEAKEILINT